MNGDDKLENSQAVIVDASSKPSHRTGPRLPKAPHAGPIFTAAGTVPSRKAVLLVDSDRQSRPPTPGADAAADSASRKGKCADAEDVRFRAEDPRCRGGGNTLIDFAELNHP